METRVRTYTIGHSQDVRDFITDYQRLLQIRVKFRGISRGESIDETQPIFVLVHQNNGASPKLRKKT
jgi:hypothetical protein